MRNYRITGLEGISRDLLVHPVPHTRYTAKTRSPSPTLPKEHFLNLLSRETCLPSPSDGDVPVLPIPVALLSLQDIFPPWRFITAVYFRGCFPCYIYGINYSSLKSLIHIHWYFVVLRIRQLMDLGKNIRCLSSFFNAENLHFTATIYTGAARSNPCLPHLPIAVLLQWKRFLFGFSSCRIKQANKTQLHERGSGSEKIISQWLESSNTLNRGKQNMISQKMQNMTEKYNTFKFAQGSIPS